MVLLSLICSTTGSKTEKTWQNINSLLVESRLDQASAFRSLSRIGHASVWYQNLVLLRQVRTIVSTLWLISAGKMSLWYGCCRLKLPYVNAAKRNALRLSRQSVWLQAIIIHTYIIFILVHLNQKRLKKIIQESHADARVRKTLQQFTANLRTALRLESVGDCTSARDHVHPEGTPPRRNCTNN